MRLDRMMLLLVVVARTANADPAAWTPIFKDFTATTPGCAIGVEQAGRAAEFSSFGLADLEHHVTITPGTVFEAGSVSKQFTAASLLILVNEGRVALSDDIRRYLPELPDYGTAITIAELMAHTSGLRDWGEIEEIAGWPRSERLYSNSDVLAITARQRAVNFKPGSRWSYSNTGYNLLAMIIERVSGKTFQEYSREHLFEPLGMAHTSWRDNFRRVVDDRAIGYRRASGAFEQAMPFENAIGHGGLLTTVGDLLLWNRALTEGKLGPFVTEHLQRPAVLASDAPIGYAGGLFLSRYREHAEVAHDGSTAGYRAWLGRYPDAGLSIALLCNSAEAMAGRLAHAVADQTLGGPPLLAEPSAPLSEARRWAGWWVDDRNGLALHLVVDGSAVRADGGRALVASSGKGFGIAADHFGLRADGRIERAERGDVVTYSRAREFAPGMRDLEAVVGTYTSAEAGTRFRVSMRAGSLVMAAEDRPDSAAPLTPAYRDGFIYKEGMVRLVRGAQGGIVALRLSSDRIWDLRASRLNPR